MTPDLGGLLSRALHAEAAQVQPSPDALNRIRRRTARKSRIHPDQPHDPRTEENPMTSLDEAAQHVMGAVQAEDARLAVLRGDEQRISAEIAQGNRRLTELSNLLAEKGREVKKQEGVAEKTRSLAEAMSGLGITAEPIPPAQPPAGYRPSAIEAGAREAVPSFGRKVAGPGNVSDTQSMGAVSGGTR